MHLRRPKLCVYSFFLGSHQVWEEGRNCGSFPDVSNVSIFSMLYLTYSLDDYGASFLQMQQAYYYIEVHTRWRHMSSYTYYLSSIASCTPAFVEKNFVFFFAGLFPEDLSKAILSTVANTKTKVTQHCMSVKCIWILFYIFF